MKYCQTVNDCSELPRNSDFPSGTEFVIKEFDVPLAHVPGQVRAVIERGRNLGFDRLYLYTSGTLPLFYERSGWKERETVQYKGKERIVMEMNIRRR